MKKHLQKLSILAYLTLTTPALAADPIGTRTAPKSVITSEKDVGSKFFTNIVIAIVIIGGLWAFFQFLLAGIAFISGAGDAKKTQEAQQKIQQTATFNNTHPFHLPPPFQGNTMRQCAVQHKNLSTTLIIRNKTTSHLSLIICGLLTRSLQTWPHRLNH